MLTVHQADILSLLAVFKCLRLAHIKKYIALRHNSSSEHMEIMLKQLKVMGKIKTADGYVMLPDRKINADMIRAFDVMMDLTNGSANLIYPGTDPFTLMFSPEAECVDPQSNFYGESYLSKHYNNFGVITVARYQENSICSRLRGIDRELTVIFILSGMEQQKLIKVENKSYFAIQDENGKCKFFKSYRNDMRTP